jgi:hypothetical protein
MRLKWRSELDNKRDYMFNYDYYLDYNNDVRGDAFPEQIIKKIHDIYNNFGDDFRNIYNIQLYSLLGFIGEIREQLLKSIFENVKIKEVQKIDSKIRLIEEASRISALLDRDKDVKEARLSLVENDFAIDDVEWQFIIDFFTLDLYESNKIEYDILFHPFLLVDGVKILTHHFYFTWYLYEKLETILKYNHSSSYKRFTKLRGEWLELKTLSCIQKVFESNDIHNNVFYYSNGKFVEGDFLIQSERTFIVIECKSNSIKRKSKDGNINSFIDDIKKNLGESYKQADRLRRELLSILPDDDFLIYDETGKNVVATIKKGQVDNILMLSVTNDNLKMISTMLSSFKDANIYRKGIDIASFNIDDLEILVSHLNKPMFFIDYLMKRIEIDKRIWVTDELDYLGYYMFNCLNLDFSEFENYGSIYLSDDYVPTIEKVYYGQMNPEKPDINKKLMKMMDDIESKYLGNKSNNLLLYFLGTHIIKQNNLIESIDSGIQDAKNRKILKSFTVKDDVNGKRTAITFFIHGRKNIPAVKINEIKNKIYRNMRSSLTDYVYLIHIDLDYNVTGFVYEEMAEVKKVGRNDTCPCGSGKKFKKCCLNKK